MKLFGSLFRDKKFQISLLIIFLFLIVSSLVSAYLLYGDKLFYSPKSQANLSFEGDTVKVDFDILEKDRPAAENFSAKLGVDSSWTSGISLQLDPKTVTKLSEIVPANLDLIFTASGIELKSQSAKGLKSALGTNKYELATGSASLKLDYASEKDFNLTIVDPAPLIKHASASAKLHLSPELRGVLPIADKIDRIEIDSRNGMVTGKISTKH